MGNKQTNENLQRLKEIKQGKSKFGDHAKKKISQEEIDWLGNWKQESSKKQSKQYKKQKSQNIKGVKVSAKTPEPEIEKPDELS